jgi:hypothetical protein
MTSATAETPTWMVCLGFAISLRVVGLAGVGLRDNTNFPLSHVQGMSNGPPRRPRTEDKDVVVRLESYMRQHRLVSEIR